MDSVDKREKCLQRRRERERSRRASETAEEREERLRKRRVRDRARRAAQSASAREIDLQQRRERSAAESPESREARLQRMRDRVAAETDINVKQTSIYLHVSLRLAPKMSNICLVVTLWCLVPYAEQHDIMDSSEKPVPILYACPNKMYTGQIYMYVLIVCKLATPIFQSHYYKPKA